MNIILNLKGSLKAIKAFVFVEMHIRTYNELHLWYREVVSDDDSTMRSCLKH